MPSLRTSLAPRRVLVALFLAGLGACASTPSAKGPSGKDGAEKDEEQAEEIVALTSKLEVAKLELDLAKLQTGQELDQAERELAQARIAADQARLEREGYTTLARARELDEAKLHELMPFRYFGLFQSDELLLRPCSAGGESILPA